MQQIDPTILSGPNAPFIAELYARYVEDPGAVDPSWQRFFAELQDDGRSVLQDLRGASWAPRRHAVIVNGNGAAVATAPVVAPGLTGVEAMKAAAKDSIRARMLIRAYRVRGHLEASLDPLELKPRERHPELDPKTYGFTDADMDRPIYIDYLLGHETATLRQIVQAVRETYCGNIGVEFMHIQDPAQKAWIQERIEVSHNQTRFTDVGKRTILERLTAAELF